MSCFSSVQHFFELRSRLSDLDGQKNICESLCQLTGVKIRQQVSDSHDRETRGDGMFIQMQKNPWIQSPSSSIDVKEKPCEFGQQSC